jgi:hypothetical protein
MGEWLEEDGGETGVEGVGLYRQHGAALLGKFRLRLFACCRWSASGAESARRDKEDNKSDRECDDDDHQEGSEQCLLQTQ